MVSTPFVPLAIYTKVIKSRYWTKPFNENNSFSFFYTLFNGRLASVVRSFVRLGEREGSKNRTALNKFLNQYSRHWGRFCFRSRFFFLFLLSRLRPILAFFASICGGACVCVCECENRLPLVYPFIRFLIRHRKFFALGEWHNTFHCTFSQHNRPNNLLRLYPSSASFALCFSYSWLWYSLFFFLADSIVFMLGRCSRFFHSFDLSVSGARSIG